VAEL